MRSQLRIVAVTAVVALAMAACGGGSSSPRPPAPTVTLTSSTTDVGVSVPSVTLTWSSTNATSCAASDAWSGALGLSGSQSVGVPQTSTYTVSCSGRGGVATASVTVRAWVPPSVVLTADRTTVPPYGTVLLTWSSQNATECRSFPSLPGTTPALPTSGSQTTAPLTDTTIFQIRCGNPIYPAGIAEVVVKVLKFTVFELPMDRATALNDAGDVAGQRLQAPNYAGVYDAVAWIGGAIVEVRACRAVPYCPTSYYPVAINAARTVIGQGGVIDHPMQPFSFVWHFGDDPIDDPNPVVPSSYYLDDINDAGQIVGSAGISGPAVLITAGTVIRLGDLGSAAYAINAAGHIAGNFATTGFTGRHLFMYVDGAMKDLGMMDGAAPYPTGINAADAIVGWVDGPTHSTAFLYANSRFTDLGSLEGTSSRANGINDAGQIVGTSTFTGAANWVSTAFLHVNGVMYDLNDLIEPLPVPLSEAPKINNRGQIIANACPPSGTPGACRAYLLTPVSPP